MSNKRVTETAVREAIASFKDPETGRSALQLGQIHRLELGGGDLSVTLGLTTWSARSRGNPGGIGFAAQTAISA